MGTRTATEVRDEFRGLIDTYGEELSITPSGGGDPVVRKAVVRVAAYSELMAWFDSIEVGGFYRPTVMLRVRDDFDQANGATFTRDSITFTVAKQRTVKYADTAVCKLVMATAGSAG